jgi:hypothetical protein
MFDIDPNADMPAEIEVGRGFMLDYLEYCTEVSNVDKKQHFTYVLSKPVTIDVPKDPKVPVPEWEKAQIDTFKFTYPTIKIYGNIATDNERAISSDFYALYESLVEIGDFDRAITHKIKLKNTINKIFNFTSTTNVASNRAQINQLANYSTDAIIQAEVLMKYSGYLEKEKLLVDKMNRLEDFKIKDDFDFLSVKSISLEAREKLNKQRPQTIGQAARISGISPSDVSILMVHLGR